MPPTVCEADQALAQRLMFEMAKQSAIQHIEHARQGDVIKVIVPDYRTRDAIALILAEWREGFTASPAS